MCTPVFVDLEIFTQADGAQSSRLPVPLPEDPYEAIKQAYLVGTDIESEPFEDSIETEAPESPHIIAPPTSLPDSTPPTLVPILCKTVRMAMCVPPTMSPGLFASIAETAATSDSAFRKRFRSSYESSPSSSPLDLPLCKRYRGMSELVKDDEEEEDDEEEDEEVEESSDSDSVSEDAEDEGPTAEDEDPDVRDEGIAAGDEDPGIRVDSLVLGGDEAVPRGQQRAAPVMETVMGEPLRLGYGALRRREIALEEGQMPSVLEVDPKDSIAYIDVLAYPPPAPPAQTPPSPEWSSGLLPISPAPSIVPSPVSLPMIPLTVPSPLASPATAKTEGFLTELGAQVEMKGGLIRDHMVRLGELLPALFERYDRDIGELFTRSGAIKDKIFSQRYQFRSLEHKQERVVVTFGAIWRPVLALESLAGQMDTQRATLWHAISDTQMENQEL
ncbi:hypothetical protein Tco_0586603 [Tanacetum coccineum]